MAILDIVKNPDPVLRKKAVKLRSADAGIRQLAEDMWDTMLDAPGVGLAAPQIGKSIRLITVHVPADEEEGREESRYILLNPEIIRSQGEQVGAEGCLSIPGIAGNVKRYQSITVKALDLDNRPIRIKARDYLAVVLQHEIDHLDGILFTDRVDDPEENLWIVEEDDDSVAAE